MNSLAFPGSGWIQIIAFFVVLILTIKPMGSYMASVFDGTPVFLMRFLAPVEDGFYRLCGIQKDQEMSWQLYARSLFIFTICEIFLLFLILLFQDYPDIPPDLALNIAVSFVTNTDWQSYEPESTMVATSQMMGLTIQNFLSAAMGLSVAIALARGFSRRKCETIGHFWVDMTRATLYILLPLAFLFSLFLLSQGVVQTFSESVSFAMLESGKTQTLLMGPVASQLAIKEIGTNGDGYYMATAAHPFENPTPLTNFFQMLAVFLIPAGLTYSFGAIVRDKKQGWTLFFIMLGVLLPFVILTSVNEGGGNPLLSPLGVEQTLGNMEGKEVRFGSAGSALWFAVNGSSSSGSANAAFNSFMPLSLLTPLALIETGQVIFGGAGSGLYGLLIYVIIAVFIASLMVGRAPEYLCKRIGVREIMLASLAVLIPAILTIGGTAVAMLVEEVRLAAPSPHAQGFSEILYAFASASNNNGSVLGSLASNTPFFNYALAFCMFAARFAAIFCVLGIAGSLASKNRTPNVAATLQTATPLFAFFVVGVIVLLSIPAFLPSLALGPIAEHIHLLSLLPA